jgi:hypothetical protein
VARDVPVASRRSIEPYDIVTDGAQNLLTVLQSFERDQGEGAPKYRKYEADMPVMASG